MCASLSRGLFFNRDLSGNSKLSGTIPAQISVLTALQDLYTLHNPILMRIGFLAKEHGARSPSLEP